MTFRNIRPALVLAIGLTAAIPIGANAQTGDVQAARSDNLRQTDALKTRIANVRTRIAEGRRSDKLARHQATRLDRQVAQVEASMTRLGRKQGFVSAAELASYDRTLGEVDVALDGYGVPRSFGDDGLVAPHVVYQ